MNSYMNLNGAIVRADKLIVSANNRGLRYGDGLFETMKVSKGKIVLAAYHFQRLIEGIQLLQFEQPVFFTEESLSAQVLELCKKNNHLPSARVRLMVYRGDGGLYDPQNHFPNYTIQSWDLPTGSKLLNENGLVAEVFPDGRKSCDSFSHLKSNNFLVYAMAALHAKKNHWNDCLILNTHDRICESTIANIFYFKNETLYTPPLSEGCVDGVMRRHILKTLPGAGYAVAEKPIEMEDLLLADEVFLSNAMYTIRWVQRIGDTVYVNPKTKEIHQVLVKSLS